MRNKINIVDTIGLGLGLILFVFGILKLSFILDSESFFVVNEFLDIPDYTSEGEKVSSGYDMSIHQLHVLLGYKSMEGLFFHHHMYLINSAYSLIKGVENINHLYGMGTSYFVKYFSEFFYGSLSFQSYFKTLGYLNILFYINLAICYLSIIKNRLLFLYFSISILILLFSLGFWQYYLTPTITPFRQVFFPLLVMFYFRYCQSSNNKNFVFLTIAGLASAFFSLEFTGFFIFSIWLTQIIEKIKYKKIDYKIIISTIPTLIFILLFKFVFASDGESFYEFAIFLGPRLDLDSLFVITIFGCFILFAIDLFEDQIKERKFITGICFFSFLSFFYYLWQPVYNHLVPLMWVWGLIFFFCFNKIIMIKKIELGYEVISFGIVLGIIFLLTVYKFENNTKINYETISKRAKVFKWDLPNAQIKSSINPIFIENSCNLFNKYSMDGKVNLISLHDSYLPFVCDYENTNKYPQLGVQFVHRKNEIRQKEQFDQLKPKYIYVDNILYGNSENIGLSLDYYSKISENFYYKVMYVYNLKEFAGEIIENDYILQEKGKLISVFKRVSNP